MSKTSLRRTNKQTNVGERPEPKQIERLSDLLLYEELHDNDRMKVRNNEYPIISERQLSRRHSGEVSMKVAEEIRSRPP
ncbi:hypothetical protein V7183_03735 [Bacillus sp. JJ1127]|uniref:hypothetical protein n=1 Tax=Bacillus sp. JJ1127 TaxID=3122952 RepID=UPI002FFF6321